MKFPLSSVVMLEDSNGEAELSQFRAVLFGRGLVVLGWSSPDYAEICRKVVK